MHPRLFQLGSIAIPTSAVFTAVAILALISPGDREDDRAPIRRGRSYLLAQQQPDGSWPETTRPSGGESYPQRLSTAGWATAALLETRPGR